MTDEADRFREAVAPVLDRAVADLSLDPDGPHATALGLVARSLDPDDDLAAETFDRPVDDRETLNNAVDASGRVHRAGETTAALAAFGAALPDYDESDVADAAALTVRLDALSEAAGDAALGFRTEMVRRGAESVRGAPDRLSGAERAERYRATARWALEPLAEADPLSDEPPPLHVLSDRPYGSPAGDDLHGVERATTPPGDVERDPATMRAFAAERADGGRAPGEPVDPFADPTERALFAARALADDYREAARAATRPDDLPLDALADRERAVADRVAAAGGDAERSRADLARLVATAVVVDAVDGAPEPWQSRPVRRAGELLRDGAEAGRDRFPERGGARERFDARMATRVGPDLPDPDAFRPSGPSADVTADDVRDAAGGVGSLGDPPTDPVVDALAPVFADDATSVAAAVGGVTSVADLSARLDDERGDGPDGSGRGH